MEIYTQFKESITNLFSKKAPQSVSLDAKINEMATTRSRQDMSTLKSALAMAESTINPSRYLLLNVYENVLTDAHLTSVVQIRKKKVISKSFQIVNDKTGKEDLTKTKLFQTSWFYQFMEMSLDSIYFGHSLIRLGNIEDGKFNNIELVNRSHVKPELGLVVPYPSANTGVDFTADDFTTWYIPVCKNKKDLGLLMKVADLLLFKKMCLTAFAQYTEVFGVPIRTGIVGSNNPESKMAMVNMLRNMGTASWGVFDKEDEIQIHESSGKSGDVFEQFLNYVDASISKAIVGQTMTTDAGASYSQANVHQSIFHTIVEADARFVEFTVNDLLLPRMVELGFPLKGYSFKFDNAEYVSIKEQFDMVDKLQKNGLEVNPEFILDKFGIPVTIPATPTVITQPDSTEEGEDGKKQQPL